MTRLLKAVKRETIINRDEVTVTIYPNVIAFRPKRCRREYTLPLATVYRLAIEADMAERKGCNRG